MEKEFSDSRKMEQDGVSVLALAADVVSAYLSTNTVAAVEIPDLLRQVHSTLADLAHQGGLGAAERAPAVPIDESVTDEHLVCLEDGKKLKMLKRYLKTTHNLTPDQYRLRWGLGRDYPMVAPNYARERSVLAKKIGLGRKARTSNDS